jgi:hypothetical protein
MTPPERFDLSIRVRALNLTLFDTALPATFAQSNSYISRTVGARCHKPLLRWARLYCN